MQNDREVVDALAERFGRLTVTRSWLLQPTTFGVRAIRLEDAVWASAIAGSRNGVVFHLIPSSAKRTIIAKATGGNGCTLHYQKKSWRRCASA